MSFRLDDDFISSFTGEQPAWGPLGYVTYRRTYARDLDKIHERHRRLGEAAGLRKSEEFWLTLVRVVEGCFTLLEKHCTDLRVPWSVEKAQRYAQEMYRLMWSFRFLPPGRGLWMMGAPAVDKVGGGALNNCMFVSSEGIETTLADPFCTLMDFSMLGVGVAGDTRGANKIKIQPLVRSRETLVVDDSREGWVEVLRVTLLAFFVGSPLPDFDYSRVREAGSPIMGFGGTASGPEPLVEMVEAIVELFSGRAGEWVTSGDIVDVFNLEGRCVVAGNVRRSAELMLGEPGDELFLELKDREKHQRAVNGWRWASNNSINARVGQGYARHARSTAKNGEPGYFWLENAQRYGRMIDPRNDRDHLVRGQNPCAEQSLENNELCNLVETFPYNHENLAQFKRTLKFAYLYAKTVTLVPTHDARVNAVMFKNRRIGCSMAGVTQAIQKLGHRKFIEWCDESYAHVQELDREYSDWLCVPRSIKTTSIKPGGTVPLLPGATPGMHRPHSRYYWRVIRFATDSEMLPALRSAGYRCEEIAHDKEPNTTAVYFPVEERGFELGKADVSMWEQLELAAQLQAHWSDNQVSCTIDFDKEREGPQIARALEMYEHRMKGISFLPRDEHGYEHAPYQTIDKSTYDDAIAGLRPLDLSQTSTEVQDKFCDGDKCVNPRVSS